MNDTERLEWALAEIERLKALVASLLRQLQTTLREGYRKGEDL